MELLSLVAALSASVFLRVALSQYPYSGAGKPPKFGDYEAQRHWMEVTYHLPIDQWYVNSSANNLEYWGLDYPPLTAYHSWIMGAVSSQINPEWVALNKSHGYESADHKLFMRLSVLIVDLMIYFPAVIVYVSYVMKCYKSHTCTVVTQNDVVICILLSQPAQMLIDHGHFQYNSASLGLALWGVIAVIRDYDVLGSIAFCLSLNYKQMELYHSLPFFVYLLGKAIKKANPWLFIVKLGLAVIMTFSVCWMPFFLHNGHKGILQVLSRVFPFNRGIFEDKVASFWCSITVFIKIKNILPTSFLVWISIALTMLAALPSLWNVLWNPTPYKFLLTLVTSSLSFFLFSFHVHEKTILLVALPVSLLIIHHPYFTLWFNITATLSMYPLLMREGLSLPVWTLCGLFIVMTCLICVTPPRFSIKALLLISSEAVLVVLCILSHFLPPPASLPDLFPVIISGYSCFLFVVTWIYFTYVQIYFVNYNSRLECDVSQYSMYQIVKSIVTLNIKSSKQHSE